MFCSHCGREIPFGAPVCGGCGVHIAATQPTGAPAPTRVVFVYPKRGGRLAFWGLVAAIVFGAALGVKDNHMAIVFGLTGALIIVTLLSWHRQETPVVGAGWAWGVAILLLFACFGNWRSSSYTDAGSSSSSSSSSPVATLDPKQELLKSVQLTFKWEKGGFDNIMFADFTVKNTTFYDFKDFEITCTHFSPSGTQIDSNTRTIYETVGANSTKKIKHFDMGFIHSQVKSSNCTITDLVPIG